MGRIARLAAAGPRVRSTALSPGRAPPLGRLLPVPGGTHRPAGRCRSPNGSHRPASRCGPRVGFTALSLGGIYRSVNRVGSTGRPTAAGPRMGRPARWSLPVSGWAISLGPPGGPHRPAGRCWSPDGPHRPLVSAGPRLGYTARSPGWAAPPGWPLPVPGWAAPPAGRCRSPVGLYRSVPRMGCTAQLTAAGPRVGSTARLTAAGPGWNPPLCPRVGRTAQLVAAGPTGGPRRPVGRCWSRLGSTARSTGCFAPPGWTVLVPSSPRVGSTTRLAAADARAGGWQAHPV